MDLVEELSKSVIEGDSELAISIAKKIIEQGLDVNEAITNGLNKGMSIVSELYAKREYYLPEIIISADALYAALDQFKPFLRQKEIKVKAIVVIGVIRGDIHDIGKNLTKLFLEASGFKVIDCGRNVTSETFIKAIKENNADILAVSTLMSPTLENIASLIKELESSGIKNQLKGIIVGGAATNEQFAKNLGVIHCDDASNASVILNKLLLK